MQGQENIDFELSDFYHGYHMLTPLYRASNKH